MSVDVDILIYIALSEEFDALMKELGTSFLPREFSDTAITAFLGTIYSPILSKDHRVAIVPAGKMGNTRAATTTSMLIEKLKPADVIVLGIAGSLSNDMEPGDVFVPDSVNEYLANSATSGETGPWKFKTSGNHFQTSPRLLNRFQLFPYTQPEHYQRWQRGMKERRAMLLSEADEAALAAADLTMRGSSKPFVGDDRKLASGPAVGKGKGFTEWIRGEVDRKVAALEMESAGVYDSAIVRTPAPRTVAIRGISDYADARKDKIEKTVGGKFRELSARNALSLLLHSIEAGLFAEDDSALHPSSHPVPLGGEEGGLQRRLLPTIGTRRDYGPIRLEHWVSENQLTLNSIDIILEARCEKKTVNTAGYEFDLNLRSAILQIDPINAEIDPSSCLARNQQEQGVQYQLQGEWKILPSSGRFLKGSCLPEEPICRLTNCLPEAGALIRILTTEENLTVDFHSIKAIYGSPDVSANLTARKLAALWLKEACKKQDEMPGNHRVLTSTAVSTLVGKRAHD